MAMSEMQKAVTLAERRALDSVAGERIKMERLLMEAASVSGASTSISSTSTATASTTRNPNMSVLDVGISAEGLTKNNKMMGNVKENNEDDFEVLQGIGSNDDMATGEYIRPVKTKVGVICTP